MIVIAAEGVIVHACAKRIISFAGTLAKGSHSLISTGPIDLTMPSVADAGEFDVAGPKGEVVNELVDIERPITKPQSGEDDRKTKVTVRSSQHSIKFMRAKNSEVVHEVMDVFPVELSVVLCNGTNEHMKNRRFRLWNYCRRSS